MQVCFDATKFGLGLKEAIELASSKNISAFEYSFEPVDDGSESETALSLSEKEYLQDVNKLAQEKKIEIACLKLNHILDLSDKKSIQQFQQMIAKLKSVCITIGCNKILFDLKSSVENDFKSSVQEIITPAIQMLEKDNIKLLLRLATPISNMGKSLSFWRPLYPQEWRDLISVCPGLSLSFSPADCLWQNIDYLTILPGLMPAIDHVEANDVEINRPMLADSGLFGPLWWRYRMSGKGQVDWKQFIEALKLYDYKGSFSVQFDDEFIGDSYQDIEAALDISKEFFEPLLKY
jgi:hypothetical protein